MTGACALSRGRLVGPPGGVTLPGETSDAVALMRRYHERCSPAAAHFGNIAARLILEPPLTRLAATAACPTASACSPPRRSGTG
jgi:hypothetical protein